MVGSRSANVTAKSAPIRHVRCTATVNFSDFPQFHSGESKNCTGQGNAGTSGCSIAEAVAGEISQPAVTVFLDHYASTLPFQAIFDQGNAINRLCPITRLVNCTGQDSPLRTPFATVVYAWSRPLLILLDSLIIPSSSSA